MVTPLSVAVKIWAKTISIVIVIMAISAILYGEGWAILVTGLCVIFGFFLTSPLLIVISPLVKWSSQLPYSNQSRMVWLMFYLVLMYSLIFTGLFLMMGNGMEVFMSGEGGMLFMSIIVVQFLAVRTTRKSLYKIYEQF
jgi:hypothetical protein